MGVGVGGGRSSIKVVEDYINVIGRDDNVTLPMLLSGMLDIEYQTSD